MYQGAHSLYAVLGLPIDAVRSPALFGDSLHAKGLPGTIVALGVGAAGLDDIVAGFRVLENLVGFIVTMPHKQVIAPLLDELSDQARLCGAVNIVRRANGRLIGDQLDGAGFVAALRLNGFAPAGRSVSLIGAGGVAAGIAAALCEAGIAQLCITNRNADRAHALVARLHAAYPGVHFQIGDGSDLALADLVVNATNLGRFPTDPLPVDIDALSPQSFVADVITQPAMTPLLLRAQAKGCRIQTGDEMIFAQLDLMHAFFAAV